MSRTERPAETLSPRALLIGALLAGALLTAAAVEAMPPDVPSRASWLDVDRALPFASEQELLDFLREAPVVASKTLGTGINGTQRLTLERDGVRLRAAFRTVDVSRSPRTGSNGIDYHLFRDSYEFEVAAYRLDRLLGLGLVPPTVLREVDGQKGSLQLWIEDATSEAEVLESGTAVAPAMRERQARLMHLFDNLIYNFDRHLNNFIYDPEGRLWLIDHTRSFKQLPTLPDSTSITQCKHQLYDALERLDLRSLRHSLRDVLSDFQIRALNRRRQLVLKRLDQLIEERGAQQVFMEPQSSTVRGVRSASLEPKRADGASGS